MAQEGKDAPECKAVFVETNLETHLAIPVSSLDTVLDIKKKIQTQHSKCFGKLGQIEVHALKVKRKCKFYSLSDELSSATRFFNGTSNDWFVSADISAQFYHNAFIPGPSNASHLQRGSQSERVFQADVHSAEARSENPQLEIGYENDGNLKSSSSDSGKKLNTLVQDIYRANCGKDINSNPLVTSVHEVKNPVNIGSLEKDKTAKKKRKVVKENGSAELRSGSGADIEQSMGLHSEGKKGTKSHEKDLSTGSDKTKGTAKKKNTKMTKLEVINDKFIETDASANVSAKSLAAPLGHQLKGSNISELSGHGTMEEGGLESVSLHVQCNNKTVIPSDMDEAVTEALGMVESVSYAKIRDKKVATNGSLLESGMVKSKKRKNSGGDVSHQMNIKEKEEFGLRENGDMEKETKMLAEPKLTRPLKKSKTGNDTPPAIIMDAVKDDKSGLCENGDMKKGTKMLAEPKLTRPLKKSKTGMINLWCWSRYTPAAIIMAAVKDYKSGLCENGDMKKGTKMLAKPEFTRQLKKSKTGNDTHVAIIVDGVKNDKSGVKQQNQTPKPKKKSKLKQNPAVKKASESGMNHQSDTTEPAKSKAKLSKPASGIDDNCITSSSPHKQMDTVLPVLTSEVATKQPQSPLGKNLPDVFKGDSRNDACLDKDRRVAPAEVSLNATKNKADIVKPKGESSSLKPKDSDSVISGNASTRVDNLNDIRTSSSFSDMLNKKLNQHKTVIEKPSNKNSLLSKSTIFKDESSSSSEDKIGRDDSNSSTETPNNDHVSSSEEESRGSWGSIKQGIPNNGGSASNSKLMQKNLTMESVLRSSQRFKKAKLVASQSQLEEDESQAVDIVPDSQGNT